MAVVDMETEKWLDYDELKDIPIDELKKEWHNRPLPPFLIGFYNHVTKEKIVFDGKDCMKDFLKFYLKKPQRNLITYAHYGGGFDLTFLHETLVKNNCFDNFIPNIIYVNGGIMILRIKDKNNNKWQFRDSSYLLKESLADLCKSFNPPTKKLKMPVKPEGMTTIEHYNQNKTLWQEYCMNDCISLAQILEIFNDILINQIGGCIGITASSTALRTWRKKFQKYPLPTYYTWNDFIRLGYYGGRCEVFNMYAPATAYYYDVKSMYPSVMVNNIYPMSRPERVKYRDAWDCVGKCGFMECDVTTPENLYIPLLPYRNPVNNKLLFPLGNWTAVYEFSLIEKALELGYKIKPHRTIEFKGDYLFDEYVKTIYPYKENNTGALKNVAKLLMNGLYGKFGERSQRELIITDPEADITGNYPIPYDPMGYMTKKIVKYCAHHQPAISARVTALSQLKIYKAFEQILKRKGIIYYCDTDSIITNVEIASGKKLGEWDLEKEITKGIFFAPKAYCYEYYDKEKHEYKLIQKIKGFSRDFTGTLKFNEIAKALPPTNDFSAFEEPSIHPSSFKEISTRHLSGFATVVKTRSIKKGYDKRTILKDFDTKPLLVIEPSSKKVLCN
jgi:hypothetical protein